NGHGSWRRGVDQVRTGFLSLTRPEFPRRRGAGSARRAARRRRVTSPDKAATAGMYGRAVTSGLVRRQVAGAQLQPTTSPRTAMTQTSARAGALALLTFIAVACGSGAQPPQPAESAAPA